MVNFDALKLKSLAVTKLVKLLEPKTREEETLIGEFVLALIESARAHATEDRKWNK